MKEKKMENLSDREYLEALRYCMGFEGCDGCRFEDRCGGLRGLLEGAAYRLDYLDEWHTHQSARDMIMSKRLEKIRELNAALSRVEMQIGRLLAELADREPVVHAHWEKVYDELGCDRGWGCSNCKGSVYHMTYEPYERCPHCGAHMDEEVSDG
jgi:rubrerythrin